MKRYLLAASVAALTACSAPVAQTNPTPAAPLAASPATQPGCHLFKRGIKRGKLVNKGHWTVFATQPKAEFDAMRVTNRFDTATITADPTNDADGSESVTIAAGENSGIVYITPAKGIRVTLVSGGPGYAGIGVAVVAQSCNEGG